MPKRPSKHQIEDTSRAKFRLQLPRSWVFRDASHDYGIDGEVEIFDEKGNSTGKTFLVQLKATEHTKDKVRRRVSLRLEQIKYFRKRQPPVLVVRYDDPNDKFYLRWAGKIDLFDAKPGSKSLSFVFNDSEEWTDQTPEKIIQDLDSFQRVSLGKSKIPLQIDLTLDPSAERRCSKVLLLSETIKVSNGALSRVDANVGSAADFNVVISKNELVVAAGCFNSLTLPNLTLSSSVQDCREIANLIIAGVAISLELFGNHLVASRVILSAPSDFLQTVRPDLVLPLLRALLEAGHFEEATEFSDTCFAAEDPNIAEIGFHIAAIKAGYGTSNAAFKGFLTRKLQRATGGGDANQIGIAHYNLGNYLRSRGNSSWAVHHYKKAALNAALYLKSNYFYRELAGCLFGAGRFDMASRFYKKALEIQDTPLVRLLYADALMFSGSYARSLEEFENVLSSKGPHEFQDAEWRLKVFLLTHLVNEGGMREQHRKKKQASAKVRYEDSVSVKDRLDSYDEAFKLDALCSLAWFNFGVTHSQLARGSGESAKGRDDPAWINAYGGFLAAALTQTNDIEAWCNAILCALNVRELWGQIPLTARCAYFFKKDEFLSRMNAEIISRMGVCEASEQLLKMIEDEALKVKDGFGDFTELRFLDGHGNVFHRESIT